MSTNTPYIGITGFTDRQQVDFALAAMPTSEYCHGRKLMVGVLASTKTLRGIPKKNPKRSPQPQEIAGIFNADPRALNLIHFNTEPENELSWWQEISELVELSGPNLHGFQLNIHWPMLTPLVLARQSHAHLKLVLQLGKRCLYAEDQPLEPTAIAERLSDYMDLVDYVLIDPSGGAGKAFDVTFAGRLLATFEREFPKSPVRFGVAGGLHAGNVNRLESLLTWFPEVSWDAEGALRDEDDNFRSTWAAHYLNASFDLISAAQNY